MENNREYLARYQTRAEKEAKNQARFEKEITADLSESERAAVEGFFNTEPNLDAKSDEKIRQLLSEIKDEDAREQLANLHARILGVEAQILAAKNEAVLDISSTVDIPAHALQDVLLVLAKGNSAVLEGDFITRQREGNKQLEGFIKECKQPYNLFYLDKNLSAPQLQERAVLLDSLYAIFKQLAVADKNKMEEVLNQMFDIPSVTADVQNYLDDMEKKSRSDKSGDYEFSEGAENKNFIYNGHELQSQVIKISKGRHDRDFTSVIKLMRDMHYLALHFDKNQPAEKNVRINATFDDMAIYRDGKNNYKRLIRQEFAAGVTIKDLPREIMENDQEFRNAWQAFLRHAASMKDKFGVVLDITDSSAGFKHERGNVANTGNIFIKLPAEPGGVYEFSIIDLDVFDANKGEHKFDAGEQIRKNGLKGILDALKVAGTNQSRERIVRAWQDEFVEGELKK